MATVYAAPADLFARYRETLYALTGFVAPDDGDLSPEDAAALEEALAQAGSEIDVALRGRYRLPLKSVPPVLKRIAVDLAVADLPRNGGEEASLYERRARAARAILADIAAGKQIFDLAPASDAGGGVAHYAPESPLAGKMKDFDL